MGGDYSHHLLYYAYLNRKNITNLVTIISTFQDVFFCLKITNRFKFDTLLALKKQISVSNEETLEVLPYLNTDGKTLGMVLLSTTGRFSALPVYDNGTRIREFGELTNQIPESWTVVTRLGQKFILVCSGAKFIATPIDGSSPAETKKIEISTNFNFISTIASSIDGSYCCASADAGVQLIVGKQS